MEDFIGRDEGLVRKFLEGMYGGRVERGRKFMSPERGVELEGLGKGEVGRSPFFEAKVGSWSLFFFLSWRLMALVCGVMVFLLIFGF